MSAALVAPVPGMVPAVPLLIGNVVASVRVAEALDLVALADRITGAETRRSGFRGLTCRMMDPKAVLLIFRTGAMIITGIRSLEAVTPVYVAALALLRDAGAELLPDPPAPEVVNIVSSGTLGANVTLHRLALARAMEGIEYEPEVFPGLIYRPEMGGTALIFSNGSLIVTGARTVDQAQSVALDVRRMVDQAGAWTAGG